MDLEKKRQVFYERLDLAGPKVIDIGAHVDRHVPPFAAIVSH
ncbi:MULTISPECIES: hypothetical protein [Rubrivivax]|nr:MULTISPECIES: hypothetical protein [Rubrivivax]EGJ09973.1 hypothetical protein RBXJA2T_06580 [Rubrivivax benzoatilyticus JA2 = ATCC BAA-35]